MKKTIMYQTFAKKMRSTIENLINEKIINDVVFQKFPFGCCSDSSLLLAELLYKNNIMCKYVSGTYCCNNINYTHAWIVVEGDIIIDITGDQFINNENLLKYNQKVYVGELDEFHKLFINKNIIIQDYLGIEKYDSNTKYRLKRLYNIIYEHLG